MSPTIRVRAPAKVNLSLAVGPLRDDGFHELATVYMALSLYDEISVTDRQDGRGLRVLVSGSQASSVPQNSDNLVWRAAELVSEELGQQPNLDITIEKGIPVAGGMAGGSADAAAVLVATAALWRDVGEPDVMDLATRLGSDVPFALLGGVAVGSSRGEQVASAMCRGSFHWVLALSDGQLSTPKVYGELDRLRTGLAVASPQVNPEVLQAVRGGDAGALGRVLSNDLQPAAIALRPSLDALLELGPDHGALGSMVSGSGPTCAFLVSDEEDAMELTVALSSSGLCRTVRRAHGPVPGATVISDSGSSVTGW